MYWTPISNNDMMHISCYQNSLQCIQNYYIFKNVQTLKKKYFMHFCNSMFGICILKTTEKYNIFSTKAETAIS